MPLRHRRDFYSYIWLLAVTRLANKALSAAILYAAESPKGEKCTWIALLARLHSGIGHFPEHKIWVSCSSSWKIIRKNIFINSFKFYTVYKDNDPCKEIAAKINFQKFITATVRIFISVLLTLTWTVISEEYTDLLWKLDIRVCELWIFKLNYR